MRTNESHHSAPAKVCLRSFADDTRRTYRLKTFAVSLLMLPVMFALFAAEVHATTTIDTTPGNSNIGCFQQNESYGQVVTVPATTDTALTSFTFVTNINAPAVRGMVYAWDGVKATGPKLYDSGPAAVSNTSTFTQLTYNTGGIPLVPGAQYVILATRAFDSQTSGCGGNWQYRTTDAYTGGVFVFTSGTNLTTTPWTSFTGTDLAFKAVFNPPAVTVNAGQVLINEFRLTGTDEFIELYNNTDTSFPAAGLRVEASSGTTIALPAGFTIPARGHFLLTRSATWSLASYAAPDSIYAADLPHNAGLRLKNAAGTVLDSVAFNTTGAAGYGEGTALTPTGETPDQIAWLRDLSGGKPKDTQNNAADFVLVSTTGALYGAAQSTLGAPGPENTTSPIDRSSKFPTLMLDSTQPSTASPNRERDFTSDPSTNASQGTMTIRRRFVNQTGAAVTKLRFRIIIITGAPAPDASTADLRPRTSSNSTVNNVHDTATCSPAAAPCSVNVSGTVLESPSPANNGGLNSSLLLSSVTSAPEEPIEFTPTDGGNSLAGTSAQIEPPVDGVDEGGTINLSTPLANNASINVQFVFGVQQSGRYRFYVLVEALP